MQVLVESHSDMRPFKLVSFTGVTKKQELRKVCEFVQKVH